MKVIDYFVLYKKHLPISYYRITIMKKLLIKKITPNQRPGRSRRVNIKTFRLGLLPKARFPFANRN